MGRPKIFPILLLSSFLLLSISHGTKKGTISGTEAMETIGHANYVGTSKKESGGKSRKMMVEVMDYADPGPNTNTRSGYLTPPPPASPSP